MNVLQLTAVMTVYDFCKPYRGGLVNVYIRAAGGCIGSCRSIKTGFHRSPNPITERKRLMMMMMMMMIVFIKAINRQTALA